MPPTNPRNESLQNHIESLKNQLQHVTGQRANLISFLSSSDMDDKN
ncbi:hypothetical protein TDB9533_00858 [Thalassocella blandensis]|nr:hypothetical protein TDB9533_00858 [Thalassocella blandensis]